MKRSRCGARQRVAALLAVLAVVAGVATSLAAACGGASGPTGVLEGTVTLGPISPVEQVGGGPNARPYAATIAVQTADGDVVATVESGDDGRFTLRLAAGAYRLVPRSPEDQPLPHAAPLDVTVVAGQTTTVEIPFDSGIR